MAKMNGQPAHTADIQVLCQQYVGVVPQLVQDYDRHQVRMVDRVQSRIDANNAPDFMVKRYAQQMSESHFPPPLYTSDNIPIDGNTRTKAHAARNTRYIEAWVLPISWDEADEAMRRKLKLLSCALNAMNGLPLDGDELLGYAEELIKDGVNDEEIAGKTGLAVSRIAALRDTLRAKDRFTGLGINTDALNLSDTTLRAFGKPNAMRLDDAAYSELAELSKEAELKGSQVNALAVSLNEATSPEARSERLGRERKALEGQINAIKVGQQQPNLTARLRSAIMMLIDKPITCFVEGNPEKIAEYVELLEKGIERLTEVHALQMGNPAMPGPLGNHQSVQ